MSINPHDHLGLAYTETALIVKAATGCDLDYNEVLSEVYIVIDRSAKAFKPELGYQFSTYAVRAIRNMRWRIVGSIIDNQAIRSHEKRMFVRRMISLEQLHYVPQDNINNGPSVDDLELLQHMENQCDQLDFQIACDCIGDGKTLRSVGDDLGVTRERVRQRRNRAIQTMRSAMKKELA